MARKKLVKTIGIARPIAPPLTCEHLQSLPTQELAVGAVNILCGISNRLRHRIGQDPESALERAIAATAELAVWLREQGK